MFRILILLVLIPVAALAQTPAPKATPAPKPAATPGQAASPTPAKPVPGAKAPPPAARPLTDEQKTIYALGLLMQRSLDQFDLTAAELDVVKRALTDGAAGKPVIDLGEWGPKVEALAIARGGRVVAREKAVSTAYLTRAAAESGAVRTDSGLVYRELSAGTGAFPKASDTVKVHYRGTLVNGTEFDSSYKTNEPVEFPLARVIPCWTEGVQKMKVGGKARLVCPSDLAYGDEGRPSIPGGAALIFEVELVDIVGAPVIPPAAGQ
jgi:FKBP-type peptidyl-prolyl cis-trans isomerase FkpA